VKDLRLYDRDDNVVTQCALNALLSKLDSIEKNRDNWKRCMIETCEILGREVGDNQTDVSIAATVVLLAVRDSDINNLIRLRDLRTDAIKATAERWRARADEMDAECQRQRKATKGEITQSERAIAARMIMYRALAKEMCEAAGIEW